MEKNIAQCLEIEEDRVNIKATTTEGLGFTGRSEGMMASCVAMIKHK
jgi:2-C-methyl-D-erythritol 2,4-cyclodiphosphate synthase